MKFSKLCIATLAMATMAGSFQLNAMNQSDNDQMGRTNPHEIFDCDNSEKPVAAQNRANGLTQSLLLWRACVNGDMEKAKAIIQASDNPYQIICRGSSNFSSNFSGGTMLHDAASDGQVTVARFILEVAKNHGSIRDFILEKNRFDDRALDIAKRRHSPPDFDYSEFISLLVSYYILNDISLDEDTRFPLSTEVYVACSEYYLDYDLV